MAETLGDNMVIRPYRMKVTRPTRAPEAAARLRPQAETDDRPPLTGFWGQVELGSEEEERLLRAMNKLGKRFTPQYKVDTPYTLPNQGKTIDVVDWDVLLPIEVDSIWHKQQFSQEQDAQRDAILNDILNKRGFRPIRRVDGDRFLQSQEDADRLAEELL